jgi:hypothetical protein
VKSAMQMKLQFFQHASQLYRKFKGEKQGAMKTTGYRKLRVTVILCITTNGNELPPYVILNRKTMPKEIFCKDVIDWAKKKA